MSQKHTIEALEHLKNGNLQPGRDMDEAHDICQAHEGEAIFDWVHALVHRIEGDDANAAYWYRRAGQVRHAGSASEEWNAIWKAVQNS